MIKISAALIFSMLVSMTFPVSARNEALIKIKREDNTDNIKKVIISLFCFLILFFAIKKNLYIFLFLSSIYVMVTNPYPEGSS